ncbi:MAG TPA: HAMP domain-containing histidine kinase [Candidatus Avibacteroides avistercoris]|uniref:histidine kinase n=1 Tax=Candidatus Avibacteroides avistercoris TaxID=2840690 RepID=A0A9D2ZTD8_9BACT|nr:HAMP domain-containing histidine kinase [Candidatus Avibacteroides avistercoris]
MDRTGSLKVIIICVAVVIAIASLVVSQTLTDRMKQEERTKMEIWTSAMQIMSNADSDADMTLVLRVLNGNNTIPVVVVDDNGMIQDYRNLDISRSDSLASLHEQVAEICKAGKNIRFYLNDRAGNVDHGQFVDVYYDDSLLLRQLAVFPYVQLGVVIIFVIIAAYLLTNMKKVEQNRVWVGLSRETAHQLGTPISSLMAWKDLLEEDHPDDAAVKEMGKDIEVLKTVVDRFSKIGSEPEVEICDISEIIKDRAEYISRRISNKIDVRCEMPAHHVKALVSHTLFEWVIENLCKNAADAMDGVGAIILTHGKSDKKIWVEVSDNGKGIPKSKYKTIFNPGYTTKERGWGLGLSLSKRIIEEYHKGRIYVKYSELGKGTTFRIELRDVSV